MSNNTFVPNEGFGSLFENERKQNDRSPDFTGNAKVNGKVVRISGWWQQSKRPGSPPFLSLRLSEDVPRGDVGGRPVQRQEGPTEGRGGRVAQAPTNLEQADSSRFDEDIPF